MPNIKRRFADDDPSSDDDDDEEEEEEEPQYYRGGGKGLRMPGGKGMGKQLRAPPAEESSEEDDDDDDDDEAEVPARVDQRGGGKQLRPSGGKQLRAPHQQEDDESDDDDDDDDDDEEEDPVPIRPVVRGGGKALMRVQAPEEDDSDDDEEEDEEEEPVVTRIVQRVGGKSLMRMQAPDNDDDDDEEEEDEPEPLHPAPISGGKTLRAGGKQLRGAAPQEDDDDDDEDYESVRPAAVGGGKMLRAPRDDKKEEPARPAPVSGGTALPATHGGKQLRGPAAAQDEDDDDDDDEEEEEEPRIVSVMQRGGGKSLMRMAAPEEPEEDESEEEPGKEKTTPVPVPVPAAKEAEPKEQTSKPVAKPTPTPGGKQLRRPVRDDSEDDEDDDDMEIDSEEEGNEAPPAKSAPKTQKKPENSAADSDAMEESSDAESSDEEAELDMEAFDAQRLVQNEEDQKYLDSLPEIEREAILAERFEKHKAQMDMKKALRETKKKEREEKAAAKQGDGKKRKATPAKKASTKKAKEGKEDDADEELAKSLASKRESVRNKDVSGNKAQKAKALAALREERKKVTRKDDSESESDFGDDDEDSDDEYEEASPALKPWQKKAMERRSTSRLDQVGESDDEDDIKEENEEVAAIEAGRTLVEAELEDYQKITLPRRRLGRWCNEPYFKEAVMNCYVKLFIGENDQGKRCYRLCKIMGVGTTKSYQLPAVKNQKPVATDKLLTLKFGKNSRDFPISLISDAKLDESDVKQYVDATKAIRQRTLGKKEAIKMRRQQDKLVSDYVYTTEDIETSLRNRKKTGENAANLALERTRAAIAVQGARAALKDATFQLANAKSANNLDEMREFRLAVEAAEKHLEEKLADEQMVRDRVKDRKQRLTGRTKDQKWAQVNKRALEINQKVDRGEMTAKVENNENSAAKQTFNPYARRKVKPKILWEVGQNEEDDNGELPKEGDALKDKSSEQENGDKAFDSTPSLVQEQQHKATALSQSHQFAIDEEVLAQSSYSNGIAGLGLKKAGNSRMRKGLSLAEYQQRKAVGAL